jgi:hypothetical protein
MHRGGIVQNAAAFICSSPLQSEGLFAIAGKTARLKSLVTTVIRYRRTEGQALLTVLWIR